MHVICLGASAGGLRSIKTFFQHRSSTSGESYVVILHSLRTFKSQLAEIIGRITTVPVVDIQDGMRLEQDMIYVSQPSHLVEIEQRIFRLVPRPNDELINQTINHFFKSLARDAGEKAIGIIMSGTGSDGTEGAYEIENNHGVVLVQDPSTAQFDGMPLNSIRFDHPDYVLSPEQMPDVVTSIVNGTENKAERRRVALHNYP